MLAEAVQSYLALRRATGFDLKLQRQLFKKFHHVLKSEGQTLRLFRNSHRVGWIVTISVATGSPTWCSNPIRSVHPNGGPASSASTGCFW